MVFQFRLKEIFVVVIITTDREITGTGDRHDIGAVTVFLFLFSLLFHKLDKIADIDIIFIETGILRKREGQQDTKRTEECGEFTVHNMPPNRIIHVRMRQNGRVKSGVFFYKLSHAVKCNVQFVQCSSVAAADVAFSARTECGAGNSRNILAFQQG